MEQSELGRKLTPQEAAEVFMKYYGYVRGVAFAAAPVADLSEDIAHDAFVCFMENVATWDYREEKIKPLLRSITKNMAARVWKEQLRQMPQALRKVAIMIQGELQDDESLTQSYHSLEKRLQALRECIQKLSPGNRELVEKLYFEMADYKNLAEDESQTVESLYKRASRSRAQLHECVEARMRQEDRA